MKKDVVYTVITQNYDCLRQPRIISNNMDYVLFSDVPICNPGIWNLYPLPNRIAPPLKSSRYPKILPHLFLSEYARSIYIDGSMEICGNLEFLLDEVLEQDDIAVYKHPLRNCAYDEADVLVSLGWISYIKTKAQLHRYLNDGFPRRMGLSECGIIFRKHNSCHVIRTMETWWAEFCKGAQRDQLSFQYACWKNNLRYKAIFPQDARYGHKYFKMHRRSPDPFLRIKRRITKYINLYSKLVHGSVRNG